MNTNWVLQAPAESKQWEIDWSSEFSENEIIETSVWSSSPLEAASSNSSPIGDDIIDTNGTAAKVVISGLELGKSYQIRNTITTSKGKILSREITIRCDYR